nr:hypothetical protein [Tanacetum cinerariifolium]
MAEQKEESCLDAATIVNKEAAAHGQKEERCLDAATIVNKEVAAHDNVGVNHSLHRLFALSTSVHSE